IADRHPYRLKALLGDPPRALPDDRGDLAFQTANPRFLRVPEGDLLEHVYFQFDLLCAQPVLSQRVWQEEPFGDLQALTIRIARELNNFQSISQRSRDVGEDVRGRNEEHGAKVKRRFDVMVAEKAVLLGVEDFEQRAGWITLRVRAEFIDL